MNKNGKSGDNDLYALELNQYISEALGSQVQSLSIEVSEQGITIHGICSSFHSKQLAQEIISKSTSRRIVSNSIVVREPSR